VSEPDSQLVDFARRFVADPPWLPLSGVAEPGDRPTQRVVFNHGLTDEEFEAIEARFKFRFPPDLHVLLATGLPVSNGFPDWRSGDEEDLERMLEWPADGICFDIERSGFWLDEWGVQPLDFDAAVAIAREEIARAPTLIPIYGHRYIADEPEQSGNPVFSVYQTDIIVYGRDLEDYLDREFINPDGRDPVENQLRAIRFWSDIVNSWHDR
jgi:hypothetical protein